jgi:acyl transferase domain-containing protein
MISMTNLHFLSPDGRSYTYDQRANGYARGEGIASVILKPLKEALKAGDPIRAIIRGSGVGQDGNTPGITVPSSDAQESLIRSTYRKAKLPLCDTRYFETHGTGTQVGDPLEAGAIGRVFGPERSSVDPIYAGSIKTNIGHLESASGLAGFIKAVMILEKAIILPNLRFENPNSKLKLDEWNIRVSSFHTKASIRIFTNRVTGTHQNHCLASTRNSAGQCKLIWLWWHKRTCHH